MFEERKLEWMAPMAGGWGGGGGGGSIADDAAITNEDTATDGQVLTANGDGTFTFESPTVGGLLTPDGVTAVEQTDVYPVKAFGASGSANIFRCTTSGSTVTTTVNHDFEVGHSLMLLRAGANCSITKPNVAVGSVTPGGTPGSTPYRMSFAAGDGNGGWTGCGVSDYVETATGASTITATNYLEARIPVPYGAASIAVYFGVTEVQTIAISGADVSTGTFTITHTGGTTAGIAIGANAATVQAALRLVSGLSGVTVTASGSGNNLTYTVAMTGTTGDPAQMTSSTAGLSGGSPVITHATTVPAATRTLVTVLNVASYAFLATEAATPASGAATIDSNGGFVRLTVASGHGIVTGDPVNFHSYSNTEYNAQHIVTGTTATTITTSTAYGSAIASGYFRRGYVTWRYKGTATPLNDIKGMPDVTNPHWNWRANIVEPRGNIAIDTAGARLFRSNVARGSRRTASAEPTWNASATTDILDGDHTRRRTLDFVPVAEPSADIPGALLTSVATTPTSTTFTLTDAPTNAIASNTPYLLAHNEAPAWRAAIAAAEASGRGGTITADGVQQMYFTKHTLDTNMSLVSGGGDYVYAAFRLRSGALDVTRPTISVRLDPNCVVRAHYTQVNGLMEDISASAPAQAPYYLFHFGGDDISIQGGAYEWNWFAGGLTEHYSSDSFAQRCAWSYDQGISGSGNLGTKPRRTLIADCRIDWPSIGGSNGYAETDNYSYRELMLRNVKLHYGGGNGDQTWSTIHGDFNVQGCEIWNTRRHGSHGLYLGVDRNRFRIEGTTFKEIQSSNNSIQLNGSGGAGYVKNVIISGCFGVNSGPILIGHSANSNRMHNISLVANHGFDVAMSEARGVSIIGGTYGTISTTEDVEDVKLIGLKVKLLSLQSSDTQKDLKIKDCTVLQRIILNCPLTEAMTMDDVTLENSHTAGTVYNGWLYEWVATGSNNEYYCRLRATGGNPSISNPGQMRIRENVTVAAGTLGSLGADTWYYGDPGALGYSTIVVKINDSTRYNPNENTYGEVASVTISPGIAWGGQLKSSKLSNVTMRRTVTEHSSLWGTASGVAPELVDVLFDNVLFELSGLVFNSSTTCRVIDWSTTSTARCDNVEFFKCKWRHIKRSTSATHSDIRMSLTRGGSLTFRECEMLGWGAGCEITAPAGSVHLIGNKIQTNEAVYTSSTADTFTHIGSGYTADLGSSTSDPVMVRAYGSSALPVGVSADTIYYRNNSTLKLYATASDAAGNTSPIDITTANGPVILTFLAVANRAYLSGYEFLGDTTSPDIYGEVRGNLWRGSPVATYAAIGANQSDYQLLPLLNKHRLSSDASREIDGFNAPGAGNTYREDQLWNVGAQDIVIKDDTDTGSVAQNRVANHTNADITVSGGEFMTITYDPVSQVWRTIGYTP